MPIKNLALTTSEERALNAWRSHLEKTGMHPSKRQLARLLGLSPTAGVYLVKKLQEKGYLRTEKITATRLTLTAKAKKVPA